MSPRSPSPTHPPTTSYQRQRPYRLWYVFLSRTPLNQSQNWKGCNSMYVLLPSLPISNTFTADESLINILPNTVLRNHHVDYGRTIYLTVRSQESRIWSPDGAYMVPLSDRWWSPVARRPSPFLLWLTIISLTQTVSCKGSLSLPLHTHT